MNIDAVITWVDGADPAHRQRLDAYLTGIGQSRPPSAERTRFNDA
ncbi:MAG: Stealth CR1 domain-containing protein, partial [Xanthomonadales bacterium]|nr:Stealth CR1 domain-containing protein [Xanthomonadales bacterium]